MTFDTVILSEEEFMRCRPFAIMVPDSRLEAWVKKANKLTGVKIVGTIDKPQGKLVCGVRTDKNE